ncbi:MAG: competence/damage-inducible protein A [Candidatus Omnitrophica bacterium]|nr:competence/damage-inducible protein A [Candidatus Omnitrophota bacterium]
MTAEIISIGTELLLGHIINTNTAFLSQKLAEAGIDVYHTSVVGDNPKRLVESLKQALARADIIITTGGLGPTVDDITIETIAKFFGRKLVRNKMVVKCLRDYFKLRGTKILSATMRQAYTPEGVKCIRNNVGTAPGLLIDHNKKLVVCLPGPPRELNPMFENAILPRLRKMSKAAWVIKSRTIKISGGAESQVNKAVKKLLELKPPTTVGIYAKLGHVELRIMTKAKNEKLAQAAIDRIEKKVRAKLGGYIFGADDETLEGAVAGLLAGKKMTIAAAESCTGGLLSDRLTNISGSSRYFVMGLVAYSNSVKENVLGVSKYTLRDHGAVSEEVALEMAKRIRSLGGTDIGIGITGIAGPKGGTKKKPVGLVYIALVLPRKKVVKEFRFKGSRDEIKFLSTQVALDLIRKNI